jgi:ferric-dicitrate binding protein FerR (iron transport regulator)
MSETHNSNEHKSYLETFLSSEKINREDRKAYETIWQSASGFKYPDSSTEKNLNILMQSIQPAKPATVVPMYSRMKWISIAAVIVAAIGFGVFTVLDSTSSEIISYTTEGKSTRSIQLADGSRITLNKGSELLVDTKFDKKHRNLNLKGEAFFDVAKGKTPFRVTTRDLVVEVTGTRFNVEITEEESIVALEEGQVTLSSPNFAEYAMKAGDVVRFVPEENKLYEYVYDLNFYRGWSMEELSFNDQPLHRIISILEKKYDCRFHYDTDLADLKLTIVFNKLDAQQSATLLSKTLDSKVVVQPQ